MLSLQLDVLAAFDVPAFIMLKFGGVIEILGAVEVELPDTVAGVPDVAPMPVAPVFAAPIPAVFIFMPVLVELPDGAASIPDEVPVLVVPVFTVPVLMVPLPVVVVVLPALVALLPVNVPPEGIVVVVAAPGVIVVLPVLLP